MAKTSQVTIMNDGLADEIAKRLGNLLREARHNQRISQHQLSDQVDINTSYYSLIENGEVNLTLRKFICICLGLGIRPDELIRVLLDSFSSLEFPE